MTTGDTAARGQGVWWGWRAVEKAVAAVDQIRPTLASG